MSDDDNDRKIARTRGGQFAPGQGSPNPGGRKKAIKEVIELAQRQTEESIKALVSIRDGKGYPAQARVAAAQALLDRAWGKPMQSVSQTVQEHRYVARLPDKASSSQAWIEAVRAEFTPDAPPQPAPDDEAWRKAAPYEPSPIRLVKK
jgi:hypothetical protein